MDVIQQARYDRVFNAYVGPDGYLTWESFSAHVDVLAHRRGLALDAPQAGALRAGLKFWWTSLTAIADANHDGRLTREEWHTFCANMTETIRQTVAGGGENTFNRWIRDLYAVIDANGDGHITQQEYADWLDAIGLGADTDVAAVFARFDKDHDGTLSWEEFSAFSQQYWSEFDATVPGHHWIGP